MHKDIVGRHVGQLHQQHKIRPQQNTIALQHYVLIGHQLLELYLALGRLVCRA